MSFNVGMSSAAKPSSRILKPPGGGDSNIFGPPQEKMRQPRAKNNQQNSDMMCEIMGTPAPEQNTNAEPSVTEAPKNHSAQTPTTPVEEKIIDIAPSSESKYADDKSAPSIDHKNGINSGKMKVPPGGFSSGFW